MSTETMMKIKAKMQYHHGFQTHGCYKLIINLQDLIFFAASLNQADEHFPSQLEASAHTHYQPHLQGSTVMNDIMRANGSTTAHTNANRLYHFAPTSIHTSPTPLLQLSNERHSFFIPPIFSNSRANIIWRTYYGNDSALFCMGPKSPFFSNRSPHTSNLRLMGILWH